MNTRSDRGRLLFPSLLRRSSLVDIEVRPSWMRVCEHIARTAAARWPIGDGVAERLWRELQHGGTVSGDVAVLAVRCKGVTEPQLIVARIHDPGTAVGPLALRTLAVVLRPDTPHANRLVSTLSRWLARRLCDPDFRRRWHGARGYLELREALSSSPDHGPLPTAAGNMETVRQVG